MKTGKKILIIDDEAPWRKLLKTFLGQDYEVEDTDDVGFQQMLDKGTYDFVILDISMPTKNGTEVFEVLRRIDQHCVVIVLSVLSQDNEQVGWFRERNIQAFCKLEDKYIDKIRAYINTYLFKEPEDLSVLVVDDEERKRDIYVELLRGRGINDVEVYSSLEEAERGVMEKDFDIYIIDICFREETGELLPKGHKLVAQLQAQGHCANRIIVPITTKEIARDNLADLTDINIRPIFYEQPIQFTTAIEDIIQRGPFIVQVKHV